MATQENLTPVDQIDQREAIETLLSEINNMRYGIHIEELEEKCEELGLDAERFRNNLLEGAEGVAHYVVDRNRYLIIPLRQLDRIRGKVQSATRHY